MRYLSLVIIEIIGFILGKKLAKFHAIKKTNRLNSIAPTEQQAMNKKAREALDERTEERKQKILNYMQREAEHQQALVNCSIEDKKEGITREEIERLLDISTSTALKYLKRFIFSVDKFYIPKDEVFSHSN